jgi:hypothetical protein
MAERLDSNALDIKALDFARDTVAKTAYWYPVLTHPGAGGPPWFVIDADGLVRRSHGHPMGASALASFHVVNDIAYTTGGDETKFCSPGIEWFTIADALVSRGEGHPDGPSPVTMYQQRNDIALPSAEPRREKRFVSREEEVLSACVELADTCGDSFDIIDSAQRLADRCVELVETTEAGVMLTDRDGTLCHVASSSDKLRLVELYELEHHQGPNLDAYETGIPSHRSIREDAGNEWPRLASRARSAGFASVSVLPMRLRSETIGTLSLYSSASEPLEPCEQSLVQAFADIATIGILQQRAVGDGRVTASQLEHALESRVVIEQAKGVISQHLGISIETAFMLLRGYARNHNLTLRHTARDVVDKTLGVNEIADAARAHVLGNVR